MVTNGYKDEKKNPTTEGYTQAWIDLINLLEKSKKH